MATIYKEILLKAPPDQVWDAVKAFGSVHTRLARNFVKHTVAEGNVRMVTFASGFVARERLISVSDEERRLVYTLIGGPPTHYNAYFQVLESSRGGTRLLWVIDMLPDDVESVIAPMVEQGSAAIRETLEEAASVVRSGAEKE